MTIPLVITDGPRTLTLPICLSVLRRPIISPMVNLGIATGSLFRSVLLIVDYNAVEGSFVGLGSRGSRVGGSLGLFVLGDGLINSY